MSVLAGRFNRFLLFQFCKIAVLALQLFVSLATVFVVGPFR